MKQKVIIFVIAAVISLNINAQSIEKNGQQLNSITTAVPLLMIGTDARAGGMGDGGVASSPDANSMHWNPAKYARIADDMGFALSYTLWLRSLVNDMNLAYGSFYKRINQMSTFAATFRYFSGEITFTDINGQELGTYKPKYLTQDLIGKTFLLLQT